MPKWVAGFCDIAKKFVLTIFEQKILAFQISKCTAGEKQISEILQIKDDIEYLESRPS